MLKTQLGIKIPHEIKDLLGSLGNEERWKIIELLLNHRQLSYSDIRRILKFTEDEKGKFNYHLKELQKSGWLRKKIETIGDSEENQKPFYMISKFGLKAMEGALKAMDRQSYVEDPFLEIQKKKSVEISNPKMSAENQDTVFLAYASIPKPISNVTQVSEKNIPVSLSKTVNQLLLEFGYRKPVAVNNRR